jgi:YD repeat-containing protein
VDGGAVSRIGVNADVQNVWSAGAVDLANAAKVHGFVLSSAAVTTQPDTVVTGGIQQYGSLGQLQHISWSVTFPSGSLPSASLEPNTQGSITPGAYSASTIKQGARLALTTGTYTFHSLIVESGAFLDINNQAGPVFVYMKEGFTYRGTVTRAAEKANILFGVAGTSAVPIETPFTGIVVAPWAKITLGTLSNLTHRGSFFAQSVEAHQATNIYHEALKPSEFCAAGGPCTSFCPCGPGTAGCTSDDQCNGLMCGQGQGRRFDQPAGTNACLDPKCVIDPYSLGCGPANAPCGHCTNEPRTCTTTRDCVSGDVCGTANGRRFGLSPSINVCWAPVCETASKDTPPNCGAGDAACGNCDCSGECASKHCGDDPATTCGTPCSGLCQIGEAGCKSNLDCPQGAVCAVGMGTRFGFAEGTNACWDQRCSLHDPSKPNCGIPAGLNCGTCPACEPSCQPGDTGPDGCGGFCGDCAAGQTRLASGFCGTNVPLPLDSGIDFPIPLDLLSTSEVGATPGFFSVTDRGTASYSLPIEVPPGRMGMQPSLSIYDSLGRVTKASLPHLPGDISQGHVTKEYDGFGRLSVADLPDGNSVNYFYPNWFNANSVSAPWFASRPDEGVAAVTGVVVQKPRGNLDVVSSNEHGNPVRSFQVADLVSLEQAGTEYAYGAFDQVRNTRGPTSASYIVPDAIGRTKTLYDSVLGRQDYVYDGFDEVVEHTDANQQTNVLTYDDLGRRVELRDGQEALVARWEYDGTGPNELGRLVAEWRRGRPDVNPHQGNWIRYYYQDVPTSGVNRGLLSRIEYGIAGFDVNSESGVRYATSFDYRQDSPWLVDTMHYPDVGEPGALKTFAVQYDYDLSSGTVLGVQPPNNSGAAYWKLTATDQGFRLKTEQFGNGDSSTREYYALSGGSPECTGSPTTSCMPGLLKSIITQGGSGTVIQSPSDSYDGNGNLSRRQPSLSSGNKDAYAYDGFDRLVTRTDVSSGGTSVVEEYHSCCVTRTDTKQSRKPVQRLQLASRRSWDSESPKSRELIIPSRSTSVQESNSSCETPAIAMNRTGSESGIS